MPDQPIPAEASGLADLRSAHMRAVHATEAHVSHCYACKAHTSRAGAPWCSAWIELKARERDAHGALYGAQTRAAVYEAMGRAAAARARAGIEAP